VREIHPVQLACRRVVAVCLAVEEFARRVGLLPPALFLFLACRNVSQVLLAGLAEILRAKADAVAHDGFEVAERAADGGDGRGDV